MKERKISKLKHKLPEEINNLNGRYNIENLTDKNKKKIPLKEKKTILYELQNGGHPKTPFKKEVKWIFIFF